MALTRALAAVSVLGVAVGTVGALRGLYGLFTGQYVTAAALTLGVVAVAVALTTVVASEEADRTETPYW